MASKKKNAGPSWASLLPICLSLFIIDAASKYATQAYLPRVSFYHYWYPYGGIPVFKNFYGIEFSIVHATNTGAAWGVFGDSQFPLLLLRCGLIIGLIIYLQFFNKKSSYIWPLAFIITGALGNVLDYFLYGHVIDMFHFILWGYDYPVFNVADSLIFLGIAWIIGLSLWKD